MLIHCSKNWTLISATRYRNTCILLVLDLLHNWH